MADFSVKNGNEYSAVYHNDSTGFSTGYYTAKEMKSLFPGGGIRVAGQLGRGKKQIGSLSVGGVEEPVYMVHSSARQKVVGYVELDDGRFVTVKKDITVLLILFILLGLLALAGIITGIFFAVKANTKPEPSPAPYGELDNAQDEGFGQLNLPEKADVSDKKVTIVGIPEMHLKAGQRQQNFILTNSDKNENICFMEFTFYIDKNGNKKIDDGDEQIYKSGLVRPGYSISEFSLTRALEAGEYKGLVLEQPYSYDQARTPLNNMVISTTIFAE